MQKYTFTLLFCWCIGMIGSGPILAQTAPTSTSSICGTPDLTPAQTLSLVQQGNLALQRKRASGAVFTNITYVPIRPHIIRQSNGTGGLDLAGLNKIMAATNSYYLLNGFGIQFYFAGTSPDYIDSDALYNNFPYPEGSSVDGRDATNAMNQYYPRFSTPATGGYAYYPFNDIVSTRSFIMVGYDIDDAANRVTPHELGHNFNLIHTFGQNGGSGVLGSGVTTEFVTRGAGANCSTDGDLICDTPADPYNMVGANLITVNGCPQYDPNSTARDAHNEYFTPSITNIMSYYFPCMHDFTPGQYDRMQAGLALRQTHTLYTLNAPATNVTPPSNLTSNFTITSVVLTWQDNANNEMGYFIERSTSPTTGFVSIGGVAPNVTTFTDTKIATRTVYYYRIRPSNTTTDNLSQTLSVDTAPPPVTGLTTTNIAANSAQLNWNSLGTGATYDMQYRPAGNPTWTTVTNLSNPNFTLYGLLVGTPYEWQVKLSVSGVYSGPVTFTTLCPTPYIGSTTPARVSASLSWYGSGSQTYNLQWRLQGSPTWTTVNSLTTSTYSITGLTPATAYEWQVQGVCSVTPTSGFTSPQSFTTYACVAPISAYASSQSGSAFLSWYLPYSESGRTFDVRYRLVGTPTWANVSSLTTTTYSLTGLTNNTQYEWQVRSVCSPTELSDYANFSTFTTSCRTPNSFGVNGSPSASRVSLSWMYGVSGSFNTNPEGNTYELQYRPVGSPTWLTVVGTITNGLPYYPYYPAYGRRELTGLTSSTTYEARVRHVCTPSGYSDYTPTVTFTTGCYAPTYLSASPGSSSASFVWSGYTDSGNTFDLRYRPVGNPTWTTISSLTAGNYSLTGLTSNTQYEWQIRTLCSATESSTFAVGPNFTTLCRAPYSYGSAVQLNSASLSWSQTEASATYEVRYRSVGNPTWTTVSDLTSTSIAVSGLTSVTNYEWQVRARCSDGSYSDFSSLSTFTTLACSAPSSYITDLTTNSARLNWSFSYANADTRYEIRYRVNGAANWITLSNLTSANGNGYINLTGLTNNTTYEWQIRTICSATESSAFTGSSYFVTQCNAPYNLGTNTEATSARLNWSFSYANADTRYEIRYRVNGAANWITLSNLTSANGNGYVDLTGLLNNTTYEWQIRTLCSATESSIFTPGPNFTTQCPIPYFNSVSNVQFTSATVSWNAYGIGLSFEVRYRIAGTTDWTTISNIASTSVVLSGLTSNTSYECQVRTQCSNGFYSDFSSINTFTTGSCTAPYYYSNSTTNLTATSARLVWSFSYANADTRYEIRYRVVGAIDWITLGNLTSTNGSGYVDLTGLSGNTQYEWQIRTICSVSESSAFSSSATFVTLPQNPCLSMYTIKAGSWNDTTVWSCGRVPTTTDVVQIKHIVTVPTNAVVFARQVGFDAGQRIVYSLNSQLKIGF